MPYCTYCGNKLEEKARFCSGCGKAVDDSTQNGSTRTQTYQGEVRKCPSCGAEVLSFTAFCPDCGHEFYSENASSAIQNFTEKLHKYDLEILDTREFESGWSSWGTAKKIGWVFLNICLYCIPLLIYSKKRKNSPNTLQPISSKALSQHKASYIENYVFPNEREAILEALLYVKAQVTLYYNKNTNRENAFWMKTWVNKAKQLFQKAEVIMNDDPVAVQIYSDISSMDKAFRKKQMIKWMIIIGIIVGFIVFSLLTDGNRA